MSRVDKIVIALLFAVGSTLALSQGETVLGELKRLTRIWDGTDVALVSGSGALLVDGSATTQPISAASLPLPTGAATSANQDGIVKDGAGDTTQANVSGGRLHTDGSGVTQPISAASLPLPTGAATETTLGTRLAESVYTGRTPAGASPADAESNTNTALSRIGAFLFGFDGTDWNRVRVDATSFRIETEIEGGAGAPVTSFPDNEPFNQAQRGGVGIVAGVCERETLLYVQINQTAGTQLITGTASERIYICSIQLVTATAQNVALVDGTGSVCATSPTGLLGGSTAATGWNFAANGGIVLPQTHGSWAKTSTDADNVCLLQSGAGQVSGSLAYISIANVS